MLITPMGPVLEIGWNLLPLLKLNKGMNKGKQWGKISTFDITLFIPGPSQNESEASLGFNLAKKPGLVFNYLRIFLIKLNFQAWSCFGNSLTERRIF